MSRFLDWFGNGLVASGLVRFLDRMAVNTFLMLMIGLIASIMPLWAMAKNGMADAAILFGIVVLISAEAFALLLSVLDKTQPPHVHTDECWEPDSGCDMGSNEEHCQRCSPEEEAAISAALEYQKVDVSEVDPTGRRVTVKYTPDIQPLLNKESFSLLEMPKYSYSPFKKPYSPGYYPEDFPKK